jgi:hypothetical protein
VYCEVFRYRFEGSELPTKEAVKYTRRVGELVYAERIHDPRPGRSLMLAMLLADDRETYVIPALDRASVIEVRGGVFVEGMEVHPRGRGSKNIKSDDYPQRWFCRPVPRPAAADPKAARAEAVRIAESISRRPMRRMPYDPATASGNSPGYF